MKRLAGMLLVGAVALGACGSSNDDDASAVCVDKEGVRVPDSECSSGGGGSNNDFLWFYLLSSMNQPRYGVQVVHDPYYSNPRTNRYAGFRAPKDATVYRGVPKTGYTPKKGSDTGFKSKSVSKPVQPKQPANQQYNKPANKPYNPPRPPAPRPPAPRR